jgi:hypothetical protein
MSAVRVSYRQVALLLYQELTSSVLVNPNRRIPEKKQTTKEKEKELGQMSDPITFSHKGNSQKLRSGSCPVYVVVDDVNYT